MSIQFKKRSTAGRSLRTKTAEEDVSVGDDNKGLQSSASIIETKAKHDTGLLQATTSKKHNIANYSNNNPNSSDILGAAVTTVFDSTRNAAPEQFSGGATHYNEIDTSVDRDARSILERNMKLQLEKEDDEDGESATVYRGMGAYKSYITKDMAQVGANKFTGTQGPVRAPTFLRSICRFDYQPDICKDYKETGYCGYGDSCKFLHDRGDYKSGWQMEKEWDVQQLKKKKKLEDAIATFGDDSEVLDAGVSGKTKTNNDDEVDYSIPDDDSADLPFACFICRGDFADPVVTVCGHYFCGSCAIEHHKHDSKCNVCQKQTFGVFNKATKLIKKLKTGAGAVSGTVGVQDSKGIRLGISRGSWEDV